MSLVTEAVFCWVYRGGEKVSGASTDDDGAGGTTADSDVVVGEATSSVSVLPASDLFDEVPGTVRGFVLAGLMLILLAPASGILKVRNASACSLQGLLL